MYRVTIDTDACEGIFACLVRDDRFVESDEGLADFEAATAETYRTDEGSVVAEFDDDRLETARQAAAACPPGAITVEELDETADERSEGAVCQ